MKKIICFICFVFISLGAYATEMCAHRDTTVVPIDATVSGISGTGYGSTNAEWIWYIKFDYGTVFGVATCLSIKDIRDIHGDQSISQYPNVIASDDIELLGRYGYYDNNTSDGIYDRKACYCKLTNPMSSQWSFVRAVSNYNCTTGCIPECGIYTRSDMAFREKMFRSIGK